MDKDIEIKGYIIDEDYHYHVRKPEKKREWMERHNHNFPYRCLPMLMGNTLGWDIILPFSFRAVWEPGGRDESGKITLHPDGKGDEPWMKTLTTKFTRGILTFRCGIIFKTSDNYNTIVTGPFNYHRKHIQPLTGMVESDWGHSFFTINWQFTHHNRVVKFREGEPIARIIPYPRKLMEQTKPELLNISENPKLHKEYSVFHEQRTEFNNRKDRGPEEWQKHYFQGKTLTEEAKKCPYHQIKNKHDEFRDE